MVYWSLFQIFISFNIINLIKVLVIIVDILDHSQYQLFIKARQGHVTKR